MSAVVHARDLLDAVGTGALDPSTVVVHQTWARPGSDSYDCPHPDLRATWRRHHEHMPNVTYVLWNDVDNARLVTDHYPELSNFYMSLPLFVNKLDFVRLLYLHRFGGVYVDVDYECKGCVLDAIGTGRGCCS